MDVRPLPLEHAVGRPAPPSSEGLVARAVAGAFRELARLRRARVFHPLGATLRGRAEVDPSSGLSERASVDVVARLSRGAGLPAGWPDVHGVALRVVDAHGPGQHQDLLLSGAGSAPVLRHVLRPAVRLDGAGTTTLLPYRRPDGHRVLFRCDPVPVAVLADVEAELPITIGVHHASPGGRWAPVATVTLHEVVHDDLAVRFDPWNTTDALRPSGLLNVVRAWAYTGSRAGTGDAGDAGPVGRSQR